LTPGPFSVWTKGCVVDLEDYIAFCQRHPSVSYFVNLDVIPGKPGVRLGRHELNGFFAEGGLLYKERSPHPKIEEACVQGWKNFREMIKHLPMKKVIPVFHQDDGFHWLRKYLDFGVPYLGISPANDRTTKEKMQWLKKVMKYTHDSKGNLRVKTHGFAVTSFALMRYCDWHSVDSASWMVSAGWGNVFVPQGLGTGEYDFSRSPTILGTSPRSPKKAKRHLHIFTIPQPLKEEIEAYLHSIGFKLGKWKIRKVSRHHRRPPLADQIWHDRKNRLMLFVEEPGVISSYHERRLANATFMNMAEKALPMRHLYLAGRPLALDTEAKEPLRKRLLSYLLTNKGHGHGVLRQHTNLLEGAK
jgi:hypothetical protein